MDSRRIKMCEYNMIVKALAEDIEPHYTTISNFILGMSGEIEKIFSQVLMVGNGMGLVKGKMFAIDGCRFPLFALCAVLSSPHSSPPLCFAKLYKVGWNVNYLEH